MTRQLSSLDVDALDPRRLALFLDMDGTLVEIAERPELAEVSARTRETLKRFQKLLGNAVAIISGRDISGIDALLAPLRLPVAGVHGLERRAADGAHIQEAAVDRKSLSRLEDALRPFVEKNEGILLERKSGSLALHYRARPDLESEAINAVTQALPELEFIQLVRGKMVIEAKAGLSNKGSAISTFLLEPAFAGRRALFAGDDITDEDAFALVNKRGGLTVKVGLGQTAAAYRASGPAEFLDWLHSLADHLAEAESIEQS